MSGKLPVLCVAGPTASGKSALAMELAQMMDAEIVNMDSMQIYRGMDIGTAKPSPAERALVPHHLLDIVAPTEPFTVAEYASRAEEALRQIAARGKKPLLVGGTGFYLRALTDGLTLGGAPSDEAIRAGLNRVAALPDGKQTLHDRLARVDPQSAARLHPNDLRRVVRALEVYELTGRPFSQQQNERPDRPFTFCILGATMERAALYERINARVLRMLKDGLLDEVRGLLASGVPADAQAMQGIGYKELTPVVRDGAPLARATELIQQNTRHYAKKQWTWFRADGRVKWLDTTDPTCLRQALRLAREFWDQPERQGEPT